jgi:hypothetical protein
MDQKQQKANKICFILMTGSFDEEVFQTKRVKMSSNI